MAERRMLHRKAAVSSDLAELRERQGSDAALFFVLLIPFYDRWGCVPDDPRALRAMVCPTWDEVSVEDVKRWVAHMVRRKMLVRVKGPAGDRGLHNPSFHEHQTGTHFEREAVSLYEPANITAQWSKSKKEATKQTTKTRDKQATPDQVRTRSGSGPDQVRLKEGKGSKPSPSSSPSPASRESAAASPDPSPGAQAQPPDEPGTEALREAWEQAAAESETLRAARRTAALAAVPRRSA